MLYLRLFIPRSKEVGVHADIDDYAQTVYIPKIQTEAKDAVTEIDHTEALPKAKIIDTCFIFFTVTWKRVYRNRNSYE